MRTEKDIEVLRAIAVNAVKGKKRQDIASRIGFSGSSVTEALKEGNGAKMKNALFEILRIYAGIVVTEGYLLEGNYNA